MKLFPIHAAAAAFVADLCNLLGRGYDGAPLDMAELAALNPTQLWFYRSGQSAFLKEVV